MRMTGIRLAVSLWAFAAAPAFAHGTEAPHDGGRSVISLRFDDYRAGMKALSAWGADVAGVDPDAGIADVVVAPAQVARLLTIPGTTVVAGKAARVTRPDDRYLDYDRVNAVMDDAVARFPNLARKESIGKSGEGRDIWALRLRATESPASVVLFNGLHHAREVMTTEVTADIIKSLTEGYADDARVKSWLDATEVWVVPMMNPDGNAKVWGSDSMWRKNTRGGYGVDINRNYPFKWGSCQGSSGSTWSQTYRGPAAGSEPETKALMDLVARVKPAYDISFHSYSGMVIYPYGCEGERAEDRAQVESLGDALGEAMVTDDGRGHYKSGTAWELLYAVDGGDTDWMYHEHKVMAYVIELNGRGAGFQPPYSLRDPTVAKARKAWGLIMDHALSQPRPL